MVACFGKRQASFSAYSCFYNAYSMYDFRPDSPPMSGRVDYLLAPPWETNCTTQGAFLKAWTNNEADAMAALAFVELVNHHCVTTDKCRSQKTLLCHQGMYGYPCFMVFLFQNMSVAQAQDLLSTVLSCLEHVKILPEFEVVAEVHGYRKKLTFKDWKRHIGMTRHFSKRADIYFQWMARKYQSQLHIKEPFTQPTCSLNELVDAAFGPSFFFYTPSALT